MELNKVALGLAGGLLWGGAVLVGTLWVLFAGGGGHFQMLDRFYLGFSISPLGAIIGLFWGFLDGFIGGWLFGWLYNCFARPKA